MLVPSDNGTVLGIDKGCISPVPASLSSLVQVGDGSDDKLEMDV